MANNQRIRQAPGRSSPFVTLNPANIIANRAPTVHDQYEQGTIWFYPALNGVWALTSYAAGQAIWTFLVSAAGTVATLTGNDAVVVAPVGGNIDIVTAAGMGMAFTNTAPGVLTLGGDLDVAFGGTGATSFGAYGVVCGGPTSTAPLESVSGVGTSGQVLTSQGAGMLPHWANTAASSISVTGDTGGALSGNAFTFTGGSSGLEFAGSGTTETLTGTLVVPNGGTGAGTHTAYALLAGGTTATGALQSLAGLGTSGQLLTSNGAAALPTFQAAPASSISISGDTGGALTGDAFTFSGGTTGLSFGGSGTTETVSGTLVVSNGGTGDATHTAYAVLCGGTTSTGALQSVASVGTSGQVLTSNGAGALPTFQAPGGAGFSSVVVQTFTSSGTYTPTAGMAYCTLEVAGGGGGSGAFNSVADSSPMIGGGGGGGYARLTTSAATIGASQAVTVGAGGAAGVGVGSGSAGGTSSVGALVSATGGAGSAGSVSTPSTPLFNAGGAGGVGSNGDINVNGGAGGWASYAADGSCAVGGQGGSSYFGGGAISSFGTGGTAGVGVAGLAYGGGASGPCADSSVTGGAAGAAGADGVVIITEYIG